MTFSGFGHRRAELTVFSEAERLPLPPLHDGADGSHAGVDEQHAQRGVQQEVNEVSRKGE